MSEESLGSDADQLAQGRAAFEQLQPLLDEVNRLAGHLPEPVPRDTDEPMALEFRERIEQWRNSIITVTNSLGDALGGHGDGVATVAGIQDAAEDTATKSAGWSDPTTEGAAPKSAGPIEIA
ncbi:hypothetical protein ACPPVT_03345 [Angustibacter sp. McL0619]|uniref:hypothetical protein n=1 Tax=Angustibacter sp. McL0619 TaxID=3415676 RepID=UPI003CEADFF9